MRIRSYFKTAKGHGFGKWTVVKDAACSSNGIEERECSECGTKETKEIPKTGFVDEDGDGKCDDCGLSKNEHEDKNVVSSIIGKFKNLICMILKLLETVFTSLDSANVGNGPYKEMIAYIHKLQKTFGCA